MSGRIPLQRNDVESEAPDALDYVRPLWRRRWLIVGIVLVATAGAYLYSSSQPSRYSASTKVFFQDTSVAQLLSPNAASDPDRNLVNQATLLTSRDVATTVAREIGHRGDPNDLLADVRATPSEGSDFILITAEAGTANGAAELANAFATAFIGIRDSRLRAQLEQQMRLTTEQLRRLPTTATTAQERADLSATIRQLRIALALPSGAARQIDPAVPPPARFAPRPVRTAIFAFVLSLLGALGLALLLDRFDRRLRTPADIGREYGLPVLGVVPLVDDVGFAEEDRPALAPRLREAVRMLRASVELTEVEGPHRRVLVTSAVPAEGKSTVTRNLAVAFWEAGRRVAVLDADLRRPAMHQLFRTEARPGVAQVVVGRATLEDSVVRVAGRSSRVDSLVAVGGADGDALERAPAGEGERIVDLDVLPAGGSPPNPQAVLGAKRTHALLDELAAAHDIVLIDTSPLLAVSDAVALLSEVDAVIVVARVGRTTKDDAARLTELLGRVPRVNVLGVVADGVGDSPVEYYGPN